MKIKTLVLVLLGTLVILLTFFLLSKNDENIKEAYQIETIPIPKNILLEVGGLAFNDKDQLGISTRHGDVWILENPYLTRDEKPVFRKYASGLHEPLGLAWYHHNFVLSQRGELTQLQDTDGDGIADRYKAIYSWPLSGNYHEYSYGPVLDLDSNMLVTLNSTWVGDHMESLAKWRGWLLKITPEGEMIPWATGLRSPAGLGINLEGDIFYSENQGDWVGSGRITHLEKGDFAGNPAGLRWTDEENSPLSLKQKDIPNTGLPLHEIAADIPELKLPAVWLPHGIIGTSTSDILLDTTNGAFGPFSGQMFIGDQGQSKITRVFIEKVEGKYQGACFPFMEGFSSGVFRMKWGSDHSMFVGMTSRGWNSTGPEMFGLQRLRWTGKTPFEIKTIKARPDGFLLEFTQPVNKDLASKPEAYAVSNFTYHYWSRYGSKILNQQDCMVHQVEVSPDGMSARLIVHGMRKGYIHEIKAAGVKSEKGLPLLHNFGYYTLNNVPGGKILSAQITLSPNARKSDLENSTKHNTTLPTSWTNGPDQTLTIGTKPGLQFDVTELKIKAKSKIKLVFVNNDDMLHNLVITQPGDVADKVGRMAMEMGLKGPELQYVPLSEHVLFHTSLLQPQSREAIYFEAPAAGIYSYLCTYPGHYLIMRGRMIVE
jgi:azurin